ncbi:hypothetical protein PLA106_02240 [Pseudomonas amygdali pv. lachrymans str. M302278]|nr:hypothetical protein PLA106_02240 [Pseudomonas amygdali pv. lachrymans str. M302278]
MLLVDETCLHSHDGLRPSDMIRPLLKHLANQQSNRRISGRLSASLAQ